jgi:peroxiredoxin family protein
MMKKTIKKSGVADLAELRSLCIEAGVNLIACQMTVDLFGYKRSQFIPEVTDYVGAASGAAAIIAAISRFFMFSPVCRSC